MAAVTWKGGTGTWSNPLGWSPSRVPGTLDVAIVNGTGGGVLTIDAPAAVQAITVDPAVGANTTLTLASTLSVAGIVDVEAGAFVLGAGGVLIGGTIEATGGAIVAGGGTAENVVWLAPFGNGLVIDAATAATTSLALGHPLAVTGALTLTNGTYNTQLGLSSSGQATAPSLSVVAGNVATLNSTLTLTCADQGGTPGILPGVVGAVIGGAGLLVNTGTIAVGLPGGPYGALTIAAAMRNDGLIALDPVVVNSYQQTFHVAGHGKTPPSDKTLTWNYVLPDHVAITALTFSNTSLIDGAGAVIVVGGGAAPTTFTNSGTITLSNTSTQQPDLSGATPVLVTHALLSTIEVKSGVAFSNTGVIAASSIVFDGDIALARIGTLQGSVTFDGVLDLGGGTLDATAIPSDVFTSFGTIENGTLIGTSSQLHLTQATLQNVLVVAAQADILHDVASGNVTLDANTLELRYQTAATIGAPLAITASGPNDYIVAAAPGTLTFGGATTISDVTAGSTLTIGGPGTIDFEGNATLTGATLVTGTLTGSGTISLANGASLTIGALAADANLTIDFASGNSTLILPSSLEHGPLGLVLEGLTSGDLIDFAAVSSSQGTTFVQPGVAIQSNQMFLTGASGDGANVGVAGATGALTFGVAPDQSGGSLVSVACFRHGTRIATPRGQTPVEALRIGDVVETAQGPRAIRWLGHRAYPSSLVARQRQLRPVRIRAGALGHGLPHRDLDLSPLHAVLLDGALVPAAALVDRETIVRAPLADTAYVHIELATPGIVFAEGSATETFVDCDSRAMFENAASFAEQYPDAPSQAWQFAAPRLEGGWRLAALRSRLRSARAEPARDLRGALDTCADGVLEGWAADGGEPVELEVLAGGRQIGCVVANRYRIDLDHAGLPQPAAGFRASLPALPPETLAGVSVRRLSDGAALRR